MNWEIFMAIGFVLMIELAFIGLHETTHMVINQEFGVTDQHLALTWNGIVTVGNVTGLDPQSYRELRIEQANVENFGYQSNLIVILLAFIFMALVVRG